MTPAIRNDSHTAAPAIAPAAPSSAKIPAPTIAPTPMNAACRTDRYFLPASSAGGGSSFLGVPIVLPLVDASGEGLPVVWRLRPDDARAGGARHDPRDVSERADRRTVPG